MPSPSPHLVTRGMASSSQVWNSELTAELDLVTSRIGARVPVTVANVRFAGPVRLIATPLLDSPPGFGALLVSFPTAPRISLDVKVAGGEVTKVPWLRQVRLLSLRSHPLDRLP